MQKKRDQEAAREADMEDHGEMVREAETESEGDMEGEEDSDNGDVDDGADGILNIVDGDERDAID